MDVFAVDLFCPPTAPQRRGRSADPWGLWRPMADPSFVRSMATWQPHSAVSRSDDGVTHIRIETPGFPRDRLHIELSDDRSHLTVTGTAGTGTAPPDGDDAADKTGAVGDARGPWAHVEERQFSQSYRLRDADVEGIKADYEHGVLSITVPAKQRNMMPRTIAIEDKVAPKDSK